MAEIEIKYMKKENWKRILKRKYIFENFSENATEGQVSLLYMEEVREPLYKIYNNTKVKIVDNGYYWLQIGIKNKNYWVTAMFNENLELIQYYVDLTKCNVIADDGNSYFYDMFLDIVLLSNNSCYLLDKDELELALEQGIIDSSEIEIVKETAKNIIQSLQNDRSTLDKFCYKYLQKLKVQK